MVGVHLFVEYASLVSQMLTAAKNCFSMRFSLRITDCIFMHSIKNPFLLPAGVPLSKWLPAIYFHLDCVRPGWLLLGLA